MTNGSLIKASINHGDGYAMGVNVDIYLDFDTAANNVEEVLRRLDEEIPVFEEWINYLENVHYKPDCEKDYIYWNPGKYKAICSGTHPTAWEYRSRFEDTHYFSIAFGCNDNYEEFDFTVCHEVIMHSFPWSSFRGLKPNGTKSYSKPVSLKFLDCHFDIYPNLASVYAPKTCQVRVSFGLY